MKILLKSLIFLSLLFSIACTNTAQKPAEQITEIISQVEKIRETGFDVELHLEKNIDDTHHLAARINLDSGAYIISPFSTDDIYMHIGIFIDDSTNLKIKKELLEFPPSVEELDTIIQQKVRFVRQSTTYKQAFEVVSLADFTARGVIEFLVEPSCIPYQVGFEISQEEGKVTLIKTDTKFHPSYKGK